MSGKGSGRRPGEGYEDNFSRIFGERKPERPAPVDPSALLQKYIAHVRCCEGADFIDDYFRCSGEFLDEEWRELVRLRDQIR